MKLTKKQFKDPKYRKGYKDGFAYAIDGGMTIGFTVGFEENKEVKGYSDGFFDGKDMIDKAKD